MLYAQGGTCSIHDGGGGRGSTELHIVKPKNYTNLKFYTQSYNWYQIFYPKNKRLKYLN